MAKAPVIEEAQMRRVFKVGHTAIGLAPERDDRHRFNIQGC